MKVLFLLVFAFVLAACVYKVFFHRDTHVLFTPDMRNNRVLGWEVEGPTLWEQWRESGG